MTRSGSIFSDCSIALALITCIIIDHIFMVTPQASICQGYHPKLVLVGEVA